MTKKTVTVKINNREYYFGCDSNEESALRSSAEYLNNKMLKIKEETKDVMGAERLSILAALQITQELVEQQSQIQSKKELNQRLAKICQKVEKVIVQTKG